MKYLLLPLMFPLLVACETDSYRQEPKNTGDLKTLPTREQDSLQQRINDLQRQLDAPSSVPLKQNTRSAVPQQPKELAEAGRNPEKPPSGAEIHYFTGTHQPSVKISGWVDNRRTVTCYNRQGEVTYTFNDVRLSYTELTSVTSFHDNGAAREIRCSSNPGSGIQYSETFYAFDTDNYPVSRENRNYPIRLELEDQTDHWNRGTMAWE